ncbi:MAG: carboxypeptidase M32 [Fibrobacterota bacterium]
MTNPLATLKARLAEICDLRHAGAVLLWDRQVNMPPGGSMARAEQTATLRKMAHEMFVANETGRLLDSAATAAAKLDPDSDDARMVRVAQRDYGKARKLPVELVAEMARVTGQAVDMWTMARKNNDWPAFEPWLEKIVDLNRRQADALGYTGRMYDALLDQYEPDMTFAQVESVFNAVKPVLIELTKAAAAHADKTSDAVLFREYDETGQLQFAREVIRQFGFDFERGRQDKSVHPFSTGFSIHDVRITTRVNRNFLSSALFGMMHECGHALYRQGIAPAFERTFLANVVSLGLHESQSRLWENLVGRGRAFWKHYFPELQKRFPEALAGQTAESIYCAVNRVHPSFNRVEADEVTYGLHIMFRFELENEMLERKIKIHEVPEAWAAKMASFLGVTPPTVREGALQDIHWAMGSFGYFPTYLLGNLIASQLWEKIETDIPGIEGPIERGEFSGLLGWLGKNLHRHGRKFTTQELLQRITGRGLDAAPYLAYLRRKYRDLYGF